MTDQKLSAGLGQGNVVHGRPAVVSPGPCDGSTGGRGCSRYQWYDPQTGEGPISFEDFIPPGYPDDFQRPTTPSSTNESEIPIVSPSQWPLGVGHRHHRDYGRQETALQEKVSRVGGRAGIEHDDNVGDDSDHDHDRPKRKRIRRFSPDLKTPLALADSDVICERGGQNGSHAGNLAFREHVQMLLLAERPGWYKALLNAKKTALSNQVVAWVHSRGGRFVTRDKLFAGEYGPWYEVLHKTARDKASQLLRDKNSRNHQHQDDL